MYKGCSPEDKVIYLECHYVGQGVGWRGVLKSFFAPYASLYAKIFIIWSQMGRKSVCAGFPEEADKNCFEGMGLEEMVGDERTEC